MEQQPQDSNLQASISEAQLRKLNLEISNLKWQSSWVSRLAQFATVFTIAATLFGVWQGYSKYITDKQKDRELKDKELVERTNNQYRSNLQQLILYPIDEKQTIPSAIFLLNDLQAVTQNGFEGAELQRRQNEIGTLLIELVQSSQFDLNKDRNVEFDRTAMRTCKYYSEALIRDFAENPLILSKYAAALELIHNNNKSYESIVINPNGSFVWPSSLIKDDPTLRHFMNLVWAYREHIVIHKKSIDMYPDKAEIIKENLNQAWCDFYLRTNNKSLTKYVIDFDDNKLEWELQFCQ